MMALDLLNEVSRLQQEMNRLFTGVRTAPSNAPALNIWAGDDALFVTTELPGIDPATLDLSVEDNVLTLKGERPEPELKEGETWVRRERASGAFERSFELPYRIESDKVEAKYSKGFLFLTLPRAEAEKPRKIQITAS